MKKDRVPAVLTSGAIALVGLAAAQPLLAAGGRLPWAADTLIHFYRLVELDHLLRHGYLFPRYAPDLAYGFGFPLFNFYSPLSYYAGMLFRLAGMDFGPALSATFVTLILCAGLGMYAWAAEVWDERAGLVSAAAYVTAPYLLYNVYHRGALAEVLAMALMPAILWAVTRQARTGFAKYLMLATLLYAALLFGHNITALIFTPISLVYAVVIALAGHAPQARRALVTLRSTAPIWLGLGLSAFFWLPAFLERNSVQIVQLFLPQGFDYHYNFVTLGELFSLPATVDPNLVLAPAQHSVGWIPVALTLLALTVKWRHWDGLQKILAGLAASLVLASLFLTLPQSVAIWDVLPLVSFIQFPWRLLSLASLGLAFLAGAAFSGPLPRHSAAQGLQMPGVWASWWFTGLLIAGMIVYGFTWQFVPYLAPMVHPTVADIARYERESGALGTTSAGDYLPNTVKTLPDANALSERYSRSDVIERLDPASLPPGARVSEASYRPLSSDVTIDSAAAFMAVFDIFYFAGWQARIDGQPVTITPTDPNGLVSFPVPAGRHRVQVYFGSTPLRSAASVMSLLSALVLIVSSVLLARRKSQVGSSSNLSPSPLPYQSRKSAPCALRPVCVGVLAIGVVVGKSFYLDSHETVFRRTRFDGKQVTGVARPLNVNFDNQMALMGFEPAMLAAPMNGSVQIALYWRAMRKLDTDYSISVQLVDERGFVYGQRDSQHPGGYPTSRWALSNYARDVHEIPLAPGTPPGEYRLRVGVYRVGAPSGLSILDANGAPAGTTFDIPAVVVKRSGAFLGIQPQFTMPQPGQKSGAQLAPGLVLLGYDLPQAQVQAGAQLPLTFYWQATAAQTRDLKARLALADASGAAIALGDIAPISPQFSTNRLLAGDVMRGPNAVRIPASTPGETFTLRITLVEESGAAAGNAVELGHVQVHVPERRMEPPQVEYPVQFDLGGQVRLTGYDLSTTRLAPGAALTITLQWQALHEMRSDYKSFVHLLDPSGHLVAGSDAVPANWTRPTTGWLPGEYVADLHALALPGHLAPGEYHLEIGLYDAESNRRLGNSVILDTMITITLP
jgi:hypothetical protein